MSIAADPMDSIEVAIDMQLVGLMTATQFLDEKRRDNVARQSIINNAGDIELVRDRLSRILDDVGGKS